MSVHWQAKQFFEHLKEKPDDSLLLTFDIQKNFVLPKVTNQLITLDSCTAINVLW